MAVKYQSLVTAHREEPLVSDSADAGEDDQYEYYVVHEGMGVSHLVRRPRGIYPSIKCGNCD